mmetsp:Transcript_62671/g.123906  ORF Transcript_62671/g.123906 Transcript_62671/m.123906 type:complete len:99 (+) Transcript_62671:248-544(+)
MPHHMSAATRVYQKPTGMMVSKLCFQSGAGIESNSCVDIDVGGSSICSGASNNCNVCMSGNKKLKWHHHRALRPAPMHSQRCTNNGRACGQSHRLKRR